MKPTVEAGSLIVAKPVESHDLQVGDIVVFPTPENGTTVTHRVVGIRHEEGQHYVKTKGDANDSVDPIEVRLEGGVQRLIYQLPCLGYFVGNFVNFARSTAGVLLQIVLPAAGGLVVWSWVKNRGPGPQAEAEAAVGPPEG